MIVALAFNISFGQEVGVIKKNVKLSCLYSDLGAGISEGVLLGIGGNFILSNNWGGSLSYSEHSMLANNLPSDYYSGFSFFSWGYKATDYLYTYSARLMKEFPISTKLVRFGIEGGPSIICYKMASFTPVLNPGLFSRNYDISHSANSSLGFSFRCKAEFPIVRFIGFEIGIISNINEYKSFVGAEIHLTLGLLREKAEFDTY
jgi:hypothetical protein